MRLEGKTAIVTGAGRGIGEAIALALAREGCAVAVAGRSLEKLAQTAEQIRAQGAEAVISRCDVSDPKSVEEMFQSIDGLWSRLDILVNNAGQSHSELLHRMPFSDWQRMIGVNLTGTFLCSQAALQRMLPRKSGRIISIASTAAFMGFRYAGAYTAAKHGVLGLTRSMALETAEFGITVNALCPGWVESDMLHDAIRTISKKTGWTEERARQHLANDSPQKRIMRPEEIAAAVIWIASEEAPGLTGQAVNISGGQGIG